jgi:uncharacterized protein (DUF983 family)
MTVNQEIAWAILAAVGVLGLLTLIAAYLMIGIAWQEFQRSADLPAPGEPRATAFTLIGYALAQKCPRCGQGRISNSIFQMNQTCSVCGVVFWKNDGEWLGPLVINYSVGLAAALAVWAVLVMFDFSAVVQVIIPALAVAAAVIAVTPWTRSFWTLFLYLNGELIADPPTRGAASERGK